MDTPIDKTKHAMLSAIQVLGDGWHNRAEIAERMGKKTLNPVEKVALDELAAHGEIERQLIVGSRPNVNQYQYRLKDSSK